MKVFVVGGAIGYACFLEEISIVNNIEEADVVIFTGGEDVTPALYGCKKHISTHCNPHRDRIEKEIFNTIRADQVVLGICRGSQFLCVMNGGLLVQDVAGHAIGRTHSITDGKTQYHITSTHHQMQYPYNLSISDYDVLFRSTDRMSRSYEGDQINVDELLKRGEPEIILYHKSNLPKCLAVQGHPEMIPDSPVAKMISNLVKELVNANN